MGGLIGDESLLSSAVDWVVMMIMMMILPPSKRQARVICVALVACGPVVWCDIMSCSTWSASEDTNKEEADSKPHVVNTRETATQVEALLVC